VLTIASLPKQAEPGEALEFVETRGFWGWWKRQCDGEGGKCRVRGVAEVDAGLVTAIVRGDVASVKAATDAGPARASTLIGVHVIAADDLEKVFPMIQRACLFPTNRDGLGGDARFVFLARLRPSAASTQLSSCPMTSRAWPGARSG
jgi:hypothetical protein